MKRAVSNIQVNTYKCGELTESGKMDLSVIALYDAVDLHTEAEGAVSYRFELN